MKSFFMTLFLSIVSASCLCRFLHRRQKSATRNGKPAIQRDSDIGSISMDQTQENVDRRGFSEAEIKVLEAFEAGAPTDGTLAWFEYSSS